MTKHQYTVYASIRIPYLLDVDAENLDKAESIADGTPFDKWIVDPDESQYEDDYEIEIVNIQPRRETAKEAVIIELPEGTNLTKRKMNHD